jgi:AcrR family transcriptional regulator
VGRHKLFQRDNVLDKALHLFWRNGYLDTSLKDLEKAAGVFKPAIYAEFGDKEGLFIECVKYYREHYASKLLLMTEPYGWGNIEKFLQSTVPTAEKPGCFEASTFTRDLPILPEKLKPLLDENTDSILAAITMNLKAEGLESPDLEDRASVIFTLYCGLGVLSLYESKEKLQERVDVSVSQIKRIGLQK